MDGMTIWEVTGVCVHVQHMKPCNNTSQCIRLLICRSILRIVDVYLGYILEPP